MQMDTDTAEVMFVSIPLNAERWQAFITALESPLRPLPRLRRLLEEASFFDDGKSVGEDR